MNLLIIFCVALVLIVLLIRVPALQIALDSPNSRSLHQKVTPRTGGFAIVLALVVYWFFVSVDLNFIIICFFLAAISLIDDIRGLPVLIRFSAHCLSAVVFVLFVLNLHNVFYVTLVTLMIVWMINIFNFMDGSDGLAGGMAIAGFFTYAVGAYLANGNGIFEISAPIVSVCCAFLLFNFSPAKIFMGDVGSISLGFMAASIGVLGWQYKLWQAWFPILVFSPFIVDASVTLLKRLIRGEKIWQAHREHYYQRLILMGYSHRKLALYEYLLMLAVGLSAILLNWAADCIAISGIVLWILVYFAVMFVIDQKWSIYSKKSGI